MSIRFNLITLNGLRTFIQYITDTQRHTIMSAAGIETPQDVYPLRGKKKNQMLFLPQTKPQHFSPHQSQSGQVTFPPFMLLS